MGLGTRRGGGKNYLSIYDGSIVKEWRKSKPSEDQIPDGKELQERELSMGPNKGNSVWYVEFDYLVGRVSKLVLDETGNWGDSIEIHIDDVGEEYILTLKADSSYGRDFLRKLENIDFSKDVCFAPWNMSPTEWFDLTGKKTEASSKSGLTIRQEDIEGEKVESFYTKDNPNGLPELEQKKTRKGIEYDGTAQMDFLLDRLEAVINEKFSGGASTTSPKEPVAAGDDSEPTPKKGAKKKSGLPF